MSCSICRRVKSLFGCKTIHCSTNFCTGYVGVSHADLATVSIDILTVVAVTHYTIVDHQQGFLYPMFVAPPAARRMTNAYVASLYEAHKPPADNESVLDEFLRSFFLGYTRPGVHLSGSDVSVKGFQAGREYRHAKPEKIEETIEGFGYRTIEAKGLWRVGLEHKELFPHEHPGEVWWLELLEDVQIDLETEIGSSIDKGISVCVTGFLSPEGRYGHLGGYRHQLFASGISSATDG